MILQMILMTLVIKNNDKFYPKKSLGKPLYDG